MRLHSSGRALAGLLAALARRPDELEVTVFSIPQRWPETTAHRTNYSRAGAGRGQDGRRHELLDWPSPRPQLADLTALLHAAQTAAVRPGPYFDPQEAGLQQTTQAADDSGALGATATIREKGAGPDGGQGSSASQEVANDPVLGFLARLPHLRWRRLPVLPLSKSRALLEGRYRQAWARARGRGKENDTARAECPRPPPAVVVDELSAARHVLEEAELDVLLYTDLGLHAPATLLAHSRLAPVQASTWVFPASAQLPHVDHMLVGEGMLRELELAGGGKAGAAGALEASLRRSLREQAVLLPGLGAHLVVPQAYAPLAERDAAHLRIRLLQSVGGAPGAADSEAHMYVVLGAAPKWSPAFAEAVLRVLAGDGSATAVVMEGHTVREPGEGGEEGGPEGLPRALQWKSGVMRQLLAAADGPLKGLGGRALLDRVVFWHRLPGEAFSRLLGAATAVLDTFPYTGFTGVADALASGAPVVGMAPAGAEVVLRSGSLAPLQGPALLRACGLGQLVARDISGYVGLALRLGQDDGFRRGVVRALGVGLQEAAGGNEEVGREVVDFVLRAGMAHSPFAG